MKFSYHPGFKDGLHKLPIEIQKKFYKQAEYLLKDIRHPSLHAKKYYETDNTWQARIDKNFRFYFKIKEDTYILIAITKHPK